MAKILPSLPHCDKPSFSHLLLGYWIYSYTFNLIKFKFKVTYVPMAVLGIPPQIFLVHLQLTELYMVWIHTEAVKSLGILEYIFNCPTHHRVHHGKVYIEVKFNNFLLNYLKSTKSKVYWQKLWGIVYYLGQNFWNIWSRRSKRTTRLWFSEACRKL